LLPRAEKKDRDDMNRLGLYADNDCTARDNGGNDDVHFENGAVEDSFGWLPDLVVCWLIANRLSSSKLSLAQVVSCLPARRVLNGGNMSAYWGIAIITQIILAVVLGTLLPVVLLCFLLMASAAMSDAEKTEEYRSTIAQGLKNGSFAPSPFSLQFSR